MARAFQQQGHDAFKIHAVVSSEGIVEEVAALRESIGNDAELMVDLHWKFSADEAIALAAKLAPYRLRFIEAPVKPEDIAGLARVAREGSIAVAAGEEWYTAYEARLRFDANAVTYVQPEMGHTGITQFLRIARMANALGVEVAPHATIGLGLFLAASLHASAVVPGFWRHEWQHSVFDRGLALLDTDMSYADRHYRLPTGPGLGAVPNASFWEHVEAVD